MNPVSSAPGMIGGLYAQQTGKTLESGYVSPATVPDQKGDFGVRSIFRGLTGGMKSAFNTLFGNNTPVQGSNQFPAWAQRHDIPGDNTAAPCGMKSSVNPQERR